MTGLGSGRGRHGEGAPRANCCSLPGSLLRHARGPVHSSGLSCVAGQQVEDEPPGQCQDTACLGGWLHLAIQCLSFWPKTEQRSPICPLVMWPFLPQTPGFPAGPRGGELASPRSLLLFTWSLCATHLPGTHSTQTLRDGTTEPDIQPDHRVSAWKQCSHRRGSHGSVTMTRPLFTKAVAGSGQVGSGRRVRLQEWGQRHPRAAKSRATWQNALIVAHLEFSDE